MTDVEDKMPLSRTFSPCGARKLREAGELLRRFDEEEQQESNILLVNITILVTVVDMRRSDKRSTDFVKMVDDDEDLEKMIENPKNLKVCRGSANEMTKALCNAIAFAEVTHLLCFPVSLCRKFNIQIQIHPATPTCLPAKGAARTEEKDVAAMSVYTTAIDKSKLSEEDSKGQIGSRER